MTLCSGILTEKLQESKLFYTTHFGFQVRFETEWYLLLVSPQGQEVAFMLPDLPTMTLPEFRHAYTGNGLWFILETKHIQDEYERLKKTGLPMVIDLRTEAWGDTHFTVIDPNGIAVDVVAHREE